MSPIARVPEPWQRRIARRRFLALALLGAAAPLRGQTVQRRAHDHGARVELGASAAFDASGTLWAVCSDGGRVLVRRTEVPGGAWSDPLPVNPEPEPIATYSDARPRIAFGNGGELYVTWTHAGKRVHMGEVRFSRSLDAGRTFSAPVTINTDRQEIMHEFDALAVDRAGRVFVAWVDKRDQIAARARNQPYTGAAIYFAVSDDRGASFRGDFKVADSSCECCRIALLSRDDGGVLALWRHVFAPDIRDHALALLQADGAVRTYRRATFDDWRSDACPHHGPSLAADGSGGLHAVWFTQAPEGAGVMYGRLREGRVEGQRRVGGEAAEHADVAAAGQRVAVAWKEFDGQRTLLRSMLSDDAGETWRERLVAASTGPSGQPLVLAENGRWFVFWNARAQPLRVLPLA